LLAVLAALGHGAGPDECETGNASLGRNDNELDGIDPPPASAPCLPLAPVTKRFGQAIIGLRRERLLSPTIPITYGAIASGTLGAVVFAKAIRELASL
jgi:hypothetical protein